jgi:hypothetical protein
MSDKVIIFTPSARIELLEQLNQTQYVAIKQLMDEVNTLRDKLSHMEKLLKAVSHLDITIRPVKP